MQKNSKLSEEKNIENKIIESTEKQEKTNNLIQLFNKLAQEKKQASKQTTVIQSQQTPIEAIQKIESKKHRPIEIGLQNQSKLELTKDIHATESAVPKKRKISLQDLNLQQGFHEFVRKGNANFSSDGNSDKDDEMGLILANYSQQIGTIYKSACQSYPGKYIAKPGQLPNQASAIRVIVEQSGKVTLLNSIQTSGDEAFDKHHLNILKFIGDFRPIPKRIQGPIERTFVLTLYEYNSYGNYRPLKLEL